MIDYLRINVTKKIVSSFNNPVISNTLLSNNTLKHLKIKYLFQLETRKYFDLYMWILISVKT